MSFTVPVLNNTLKTFRKEKVGATFKIVLVFYPEHSEHPGMFTWHPPVSKLRQHDGDPSLSPGGELDLLGVSQQVHHPRAVHLWCPQL